MSREQSSILCSLFLRSSLWAFPEPRPRQLGRGDPALSPLPASPSAPGLQSPSAPTPTALLPKSPLKLLSPCHLPVPETSRGRGQPTNYKMQTLLPARVLGCQAEVQSPGVLLLPSNRTPYEHSSPPPPDPSLTPDLSAEHGKTILSPQGQNQDLGAGAGLSALPSFTLLWKTRGDKCGPRADRETSPRTWN